MLQIKIYKIELPSTDDLFIQSLNSRHTSKLCYSLIKFSILLLVPDKHRRLPLRTIEAEVGPASPDPLLALHNVDEDPVTEEVTHVACLDTCGQRGGGHVERVIAVELASWIVVRVVGELEVLAVAGRVFVVRAGEFVRTELQLAARKGYSRAPGSIGHAAGLGCNLLAFLVLPGGAPGVAGGARRDPLVVRVHILAPPARVLGCRVVLELFAK